MPHPSDSIASELRAAVLAGDHARARRLVQDYAEALQELWRALPEAERAGSPIPSQARELLGWARDMTLVQRALAARHLAIVETASRYESSPGTRDRSTAIQVHA
ncbi:MAG TPA: hypothetical protein VMB25_17870 [Bryobacteraceae bacterium]|nr:hypothetical protein [Bryobacteraceae bacterium]